MALPSEEKTEKPKKQGGKSASKSNVGWMIRITLMTFAISVALSVISSTILESVGLGVAIFILLLFIVTGILFDIIGVAVTTASEIPFHSMAAKKVRGANRAIRMIKNAEKVANLCNDVVGDICGIVSGSTGAVIVATLVLTKPPIVATVASIIMTALISAMTVGGKAIGKSLAITKSDDIIFQVAKILSLFENKKKRG